MLKTSVISKTVGLLANADIPFLHARAQFFPYEMEWVCVSVLLPGEVMKKCPYCGREYPDAAKVCVVDQHELIDPGRMRASAGEVAVTTYFLYRLIMGILVGMIVASVSILAAWESTKNLAYADPQQFATRSTLEQIQAAVTQYQRVSHSPPASLADLHKSTNTSPMSVGQFLDGWNRPFLYSTNGTNWVIKSYGRDGKPGGFGLDYDLTGDAPYPPGAHLTLAQFIQAPRCKRMILASVLCGILSCGLTSLTIKRPPTTRMGVIGLITALGMTAFAAVLVACFITLLHIPSGH